MQTVFPDQVENHSKSEFFGGAPHVFFVEVGANAPHNGARSWQFERAGWNGVPVILPCRFACCATACAVCETGFVVALPAVSAAAEPALAWT